MCLFESWKNLTTKVTKEAQRTQKFNRKVRKALRKGRKVFLKIYVNLCNLCQNLNRKVRKGLRKGRKAFLIFNLWKSVQSLFKTLTAKHAKGYARNAKFSNF